MMQEKKSKWVSENRRENLSKNLSKILLEHRSEILPKNRPKKRSESDIVDFPITKSTMSSIKKENISLVPLIMINSNATFNRFKPTTEKINQNVYEAHSHGVFRYIALFANLGLLAGIYHGAHEIPHDVQVTAAQFQDLKGNESLKLDAAHYYGAAYKNLESDLGDNAVARAAIEYVNNVTGKTGFSVGGSCTNRGAAEKRLDTLDKDIAKEFIKFLKSNITFYNSTIKSKLSTYHEAMIGNMTEVYKEFRSNTSNDATLNQIKIDISNNKTLNNYCINSNAAGNYIHGMKGVSKYLYEVYNDAHKVGWNYGFNIFLQDSINRNKKSQSQFLL